MPVVLGAASSLVLVELLIVVAGVAILIIIVVSILANPNGPPVAGPCGLVRRTIRKDYCSGGCTPLGQTCVVLTSKPYAWGIFGATQAASCTCGVVIGLPPPGSVPGLPGGAGGGLAPSPGSGDIAPVTGDTHPH